MLENSAKSSASISFKSRLLKLSGLKAVSEAVALRRKDVQRGGGKQAVLFSVFVCDE